MLCSAAVARKRAVPHATNEYEQTQQAHHKYRGDEKETHCSALRLHPAPANISGSPTCHRQRPRRSLWRRSCDHGHPVAHHGYTWCASKRSDSTLPVFCLRRKLAPGAKAGIVMSASASGSAVHLNPGQAKRRTVNGLEPTTHFAGSRWRDGRHGICIEGGGRREGRTQRITARWRTHLHWKTASDDALAGTAESVVGTHLKHSSVSTDTRRGNATSASTYRRPWTTTSSSVCGPAQGWGRYLHIMAPGVRGCVTGRALTTAARTANRLGLAYGPWV